MISILKEKRLLAYLIGNLSSITATWGQRVIVFWIAWEISNSSAVIGTLAALELLPSVLAAPFVGVMTDRWSAMRLARDIQLLSALPPIVLFVFGLMDEITVPVLMALSVATGLLNGLDHPLRLLLVGKIVSKDKVAQGVAINSVVFNVGRMIGPTVGGWIVVTHAINLIFIFNAVSYFLFALIFTVLMKKEEKSTNDAQEDGYENQAVESFFRVAFKSNIGPMFVTFSIIALLLRPIFELLPGFTSRLQSSTIEGAQVFSWMTTAQGFGAMCGGVLISFLMTKCKIELMSLVSSFLAVGATAIFITTSSVITSLLSLVVLSGTILVNAISTQIAIQTQLPERLRGRALSLYTITFRGMPAIGAFVFGTFGEHISLEHTFLWACLAVFCLIIFQSKQLPRP